MKPYTSGPETPVRFTPLPLKLFAVIIPATTIPSALDVIEPTPAVCVILLTIISDAI